MAFQALPPISDETLDWITNSLLPELAELADNLTTGLERVDEERNGLAASNPNLAKVVDGVVESLYEVFKDVLPGERARAELRLFGFYTAIVLLRALDMELRRGQQP